MDNLTPEQIGSIIGAVCTGGLLGGGFIIGLILRIFPWQKNNKRATSEQQAAIAAPDITDTMQGRDLDATKNALVVVSNTLGKAQDQLEASQIRLAEAQAEIEASKAGRAADRAAREQLAEQMKSLQSRVDKLTVEKESGESTIKALREELAAKDGQIAQLEQQYETACEDIAALYAFVRGHIGSTDEMPVLKTHLKPKTGPLTAPLTDGTMQKSLQESGVTKTDGE